MVKIPIKLMLLLAFSNCSLKLKDADFNFLNHINSNVYLITKIKYTFRIIGSHSTHVT